MLDFDSLLQTVSVGVEHGTPVLDPATEEVLGYAPAHTVDDLESIIASAAAAQPGWQALGHEGRAAVLLRAADRIDASAEALAQLIAREQGKPLNMGARIEASGCSRWLRAAAQAELPPQTVLDDGTVKAVLSYEPIGVVAAIGPWNWPVMISLWQFASALRMGNTVVLKPSEFTPLCVLALLAIVNQELPPGVLTGVSGGREIGARLAGHPRIGKVMFTGSTATGRHIVRASADNLARLTLELGGNDAAIVLPDADVEAIAPDLFWSAFLNVGQTCGALKRLYVHDSLYDALCQALVKIAAGVPMGRGSDEAALLGPLTNRPQWEIVDRLVESARASGARILIGGNPDRAAPGYFYPVTLVADIAPDHPLVEEEQFGPALPIIRYHDIDEAVAEANRLPVGLDASVWGRDKARALEVAQRLQAGTVTVNRHSYVHPDIPFGGTKQSGYGVEFGIEGLKAVALPRVIVA